ncbi:MAG TPA: hypothetical protein VLG25_00520 [Patescibacteria group bacterium]|nr:hypothetical protein [Patescibacteria group bacterium]
MEKYTRLDIEIKDGQLVSPAATYLVQPGTKLEFHIISNTFGKITVPTNPLQTITFTESPLIFKFSAPTQPGSYDLPYKANDTDQVINLGIITVRDK